MCRHIGYLGDAVPVGEIITRGPHSLRVQSWAPNEMRGGAKVNADGFGVAWWRASVALKSAATDTAQLLGHRADAGDPDPANGGAQTDPEFERSGDAVESAAHQTVSDPLPVSRYRNAAPIWTDPAVDEVLPQLTSRAVLGAIRSATSGMPVERAACAPFVHGHWAFSHNGAVRDWRRTLTAVCADLDAAALSAGASRLFEDELLLTAESPTDSATVWVLLARLLDAIAPGGFVDSPATALRLITEAILAHAPTSRLNFLLGDGETLWATTVHHSLYALVTDSCAILSSEPYDDDPAWRSIADRRLVIARPGHLSDEPLTTAESTKTVDDRLDSGTRKA
ncbi:ergothioneine biosynthesis protein EgtC [Nocardia arthritidis]|uniref:Gamma-glutamyl-hercynylcysteine sulfoxide hydrolase n=1 Tax=Nocardia arthritidis TaxID=228602 RepID=A0A6G9YRJ6_9NOCA|nr:ergothioneine biosynthesis protein EgtC [Nocardia arthritidis]QIS15717.1 ergothioneine biosynthesis protein EgtC [Nocardia arthritidis]